VHITDTGPGIPIDQQEKVFRPWYSTKPGGTGLGLPMTRRIIEELGGELRLQSEPGRGTRFTATVPRAPRQLTSGDDEASA
jgi:signal transduction histidine kinase